MNIVQITVFILLVQIFGAYGQTIVPRAGIAISTTTLKSSFPTTEVRPRASFLFGVGAEFHMDKKLDLLVGIEYLSRSYQVYNDMPFGSGRSIFDLAFKHNYLDFPFLLKRYFGNTPINFYFGAGGYVGVGIGGKKEGKLSFRDPTAGNTYIDLDGVIKYGPDPDVEQFEYQYYDNRIDFGAVACGGLLLWEVAIVDFRYSFGLVDIDKEAGGFKNRTLEIVFSVPLKLHKDE